MVVGVVSGDDLVWAEGFGFADVEARRPMRTDTRFRMASHSKLFTATAIMQLREQGRIRLDDPVTDYLPAAPVGEGATVGHLLSGRHGIPRVLPTLYDISIDDAISGVEQLFKSSIEASRVAAIVIEPVTGDDLQKDGSLVVIPRSGTTITDADVREQRFIDQR